MTLRDPCRPDFCFSNESERALGEAWRAFVATWIGYIAGADLTPDDIEAEVRARGNALRQLAKLYDADDLEAIDRATGGP
jgi:hypothetical protein